MVMRSVVSVRPTVSTLAVNQLTYDTDFSLLAYTRDATLARVLATALRSSVCVSVCLSVTSRSSIETAERIQLTFGKKSSSGISYTVFSGNLGTSNNGFCQFCSNRDQLRNPTLGNRVRATFTCFCCRHNNSTNPRQNRGDTEFGP